VREEGEDAVSERKKFSITRAAVAATVAVTPRRFVASFDATHLDTAAVAQALRALADAVEAPARLAAQAAALRTRVAAQDPDLATITRLEPQVRDDAYPILANGQQVGSAAFAIVQPRRRFAPFADEDTPDDEYDGPEDEDGEEDEGEGDEDAAYEEDDDVEFYQHDIWKAGIIIDRSSLFTYLVENTYGQRLEVNVQALRRPED
jgi:hypothetical protein